MKKLIAVLGLLTLAGIAYAATEKVERVGSYFPPFFNKGLYVGPDSPNPANDTQNKVSRLLATSEVVDYSSTTIVCADSTGVTVTGAQTGDGCEVGYATAPGNGTFSCYVDAANHVKGHFCPAGTSVDPASGTFRYYIRSNQ